MSERITCFKLHDFLNKTLSGLISLCIIPLLCKFYTANKIYFVIYDISAIVKGISLCNKWPKDYPAQKGVIIYTNLSS